MAGDWTRSGCPARRKWAHVGTWTSLGTSARRSAQTRRRSPRSRGDISTHQRIRVGTRRTTHHQSFSLSPDYRGHGGCGRSGLPLLQPDRTAGAGAVARLEIIRAHGRDSRLRTRGRSRAQSAECPRSGFLHFPPPVAWRTIRDSRLHGHAPAAFVGASTLARRRQTTRVDPASAKRDASRSVTTWDFDFPRPQSIFRSKSSQRPSRRRDQFAVGFASSSKSRSLRLAIPARISALSSVSISRVISICAVLNWAHSFAVACRRS